MMVFIVFSCQNVRVMKITAWLPHYGMPYNQNKDRCMIGAHQMSMKGKNECPLSLQLPSSHTNISYKTLKREKRQVCESISENLGDREVINYSRVIPFMEKNQEGQSSFKDEREAVFISKASKEKGKVYGGASLGLRHDPEG